MQLRWVIPASLRGRTLELAFARDAGNNIIVRRMRDRRTDNTQYAWADGADIVGEFLSEDEPELLTNEWRSITRQELETWLGP